MIKLKQDLILKWLGDISARLAEGKVMCDEAWQNTGEYNAAFCVKEYISAA